jgi:hypothetical protein
MIKSEFPAQKEQGILLTEHGMTLAGQSLALMHEGRDSANEREPTPTAHHWRVNHLLTDFASQRLFPTQTHPVHRIRI